MYIGTGRIAMQMNVSKLIIIRERKSSSKSSILLLLSYFSLKLAW